MPNQQMATQEKLAHLHSALKDCIQQIHGLQEERELEMEQKEANKRLICSLVCNRELVDQLERDKLQLEAQLDELIIRLESVDKENAFLKRECSALRSSTTNFRILADRLCDVEQRNKALVDIIKARENELCSSKLKCAQMAYKLAVIEADNSKIDQLCTAAHLHSSQIGNASEDSQNQLEPVSKQIVPLLQANQQDDGSTGMRDDALWPWNTVQLILEEHRVSKRSISDLLEDIKGSLPPQSSSEETGDLERSISGSELHVTNSCDCENVTMEMTKIQCSLQEENTSLKQKLASLETNLSLATENNELLMRQHEESTASMGRLQEELEDLSEDQKLMNEDLDTQLTAANVKNNEMKQRVSSLEIELEDKKQRFEELEATCLELQLQLEILSRNGSPYLEEDEAKQIGWEMITDCTKLALITENKPADKGVKKNGKQRYSLRDRMCADEDRASVSPMTTRSLSLAVVPVKKTGGFGFIRKMFLRRRKCNTKKPSTLLHRNSSSMMR